MPWTPGLLVRNIQNPELGPGRVVSVDEGGQIEVQLLWQEGRYLLQSAHAPLERYILTGGVPFKCRPDGTGQTRLGLILERLEDPPDAHWIYRVAVQVEALTWSRTDLAESEIYPVPPPLIAPLGRLKTLCWQGPTRFLRRWRMRLIESRWIDDSGGIPVLLGARIQPMAHQVYAVRRILWDRAPRFVLADEVGLGKTIEAGLVIQSLLTKNPKLRFLVIAPGSMSRQWQSELYLRFGGLACRHIDAASIASLSVAHRHRQIDHAQLIVSTTALQTTPILCDDLLAQHWDLVVIDEAHQFPPGTDLYGLFYRLAKVAAGFLVLSATPSKRELTSLAGLLALVAPETYGPTDLDALSRRLEDQKAIWDRLSFTLKAIDAAREEPDGLSLEDFDFLAGEWSGLLDDDPVVTDLLGQVRGGELQAAMQLVAYVQEHHRLDHRIIRTRRRTLLGQRQHWSTRTLERLAYNAGTEELVLANHLEELPQANPDSGSQLALRAMYQRFFATTPRRLVAFLGMRSRALQVGTADGATYDPMALLAADPGPGDEAGIIDGIVQTTPPFSGEHTWIESALGLALDWLEREPIPARIRFLIERLEKELSPGANTQTLIFTQDKDLVEELVERLHELLPKTPVRGFHHGMAEPDLARVAIDFQRNHNCRILVSDELGGEGRNFQNADLVVHFDIPWSVSRLEQRIGRLDRVGRGTDRPVLSLVLCGPTATESSLLQVHAGLFRVFERSVGGLEYVLPTLQRDLNQAIALGAQAVQDLAPILADRIEQELGDVDEAFALSLDASRLHLDDAQELAEVLTESGDNQEDASQLAQWARSLGIDARQQADGRWDLQWTASQLTRPVPELSESGFLTGTFDRQRALADDATQFLGPGHSVISALFADLDHCAEGRSTVMTLALGPPYQGRLFALILGRCHPDTNGLSELDPSPGLSVRAQRHYWPEVQPALFELHMSQEPAATPVRDARLIRLLYRPDRIDKEYFRIKANDLVEGTDTLALWAAVEQAIQLAKSQIRAQRRPLVEQAAQALTHDLGPEIGFLRWQQANTPNEATQRDILARERLPDSIRNEQITTEAIAVIVAV